MIWYNTGCPENSTSLIEFLVRCYTAYIEKKARVAWLEYPRSVCSSIKKRRKISM